MWQNVSLIIDMMQILTDHEQKTHPAVIGNITLNTALVLGIGTTVLGLILLHINRFQAALFAFWGWFVNIVLYIIGSKRGCTLIVNKANGNL
ncbi:hypothetical protein GCM10028868_23810 [Virgibacillus kimchii]